MVNKRILFNKFMIISFIREGWYKTLNKAYAIIFVNNMTNSSTIDDTLIKSMSIDKVEQ
jgi:hypothetical protein